MVSKNFRQALGGPVEQLLEFRVALAEVGISRPGRNPVRVARVEEFLVSSKVVHAAVLSPRDVRWLVVPLYLLRTWLMNTHRLRWPKWVGDVEAEFASSKNASFGLIDSRHISDLARSMPSVISDGAHYCIPGVPTAMLNAWATRWLL